MAGAAAVTLLVVAAGFGCGRESAPPRSPNAEALDLDEAPVSPRSNRRPPEPAPRKAATPPAASPDRAGGRHRYRGKKIDINLAQAELHDVFRLLAEVGGVNIVVADDVKGTISLRLRQVPWDQVLDTVVAAKHLSMVLENGIYRVTAR